MWLFVSQVGLPGACGTDEPHVARSEPCVALCEPCVALCEPGGASGTDVFYSVLSGESELITDRTIEKEFIGVVFSCLRF